MNFKQLKKKIKEEQKIRAANIKRGKFLRKPRNWSTMTAEEDKMYIYIYDNYGSRTKSFKNYVVDEMCSRYRATHIAYCSFFNNTPYDKIENPRKNNKPDTNLIHKLRKQWESELDAEVVRDCA